MPPAMKATTLASSRAIMPAATARRMPTAITCTPAGRAAFRPIRPAPRLIPATTQKRCQRQPNSHRQMPRTQMVPSIAALRPRASRRMSGAMSCMDGYRGG